MHTLIRSKSDAKAIYCSFIYAENKYQLRRDLWDNLNRHKFFVADKPWIVLGDFNSAFSQDDCLVGSSNMSIGMREFAHCVQQNEWIDIKSHGMQFTWNQKPKNGVGILKKIDRAMGNLQLLDDYPDVFVFFHPFRVSDHTPCIVKLQILKNNSQKPFKFANFLVKKDGFLEKVASVWSKPVRGVTMYSVVKKLASLKSPMRRLLFMQGNIHERVILLRKKLDEIQLAIDANPLDVSLREAESLCLHEFQSVSYDEECFLKQKSKADWLAAGDSNTKFFHNSVKMRNAYMKIHSIHDSSGDCFYGDDVYGVLVSHYSKFLGVQDPVDSLPGNLNFPNVLDPNVASNMVRPVTEEEVKKAIFSIGENKAPGTS
ncbi:uncharacterized protein LOC110931619 [Helianthus annuus]|uniref:uncharacterized protein LOC110931619 n=1 Tax=Helianthus annuus TaxID=4232 RepID=UPI000B8FE144|nr:uncharacterized protein LOC110931619 [Helianthus annuus]